MSVNDQFGGPMGRAQTATRCYHTVISAALTLGLVYLDLFTGSRVSLRLFYLIPLGEATWYVRRSFGVVLAVFAGFGWYVDSRLPPQAGNGVASETWELATHIAFLIIICCMLDWLRQKLAAESELARTDYLTGIANLRSFRDTLKAEIARSRRAGRPLTLVSIDCDDFKRINDTEGHRAGDDVLAAIASTLRREVRAADTVARVGGDEFAVLFPETDAEAAQRAVTRLQEASGRALKSRKHPVTLSFGVCTFNDPPQSYDEAMTLADEAMYCAKARGKNVAGFVEYKEPQAAA